MADTHETIADIRKEAEAKFRELIEARMQRRSTFQTTLGAMQAFNNVFDRLKAAHKRERGDSAKLREALKDIVRIVEQIRLLYSDFPYEIHDIARKARAALAATEKEGGNDGNE